jgi:hypothetical protein
VIAWFVAVIVGFGLIQTTVPISWLSWLGWWARGPFKGSSLGILVAFAVAGVLYGLLGLVPFPGTVQPSPAPRGTSPSAGSE